jgi:hypothetical protein
MVVVGGQLYDPAVLPPGMSGGSQSYESAAYGSQTQVFMISKLHYILSECRQITYMYL